MNLRILVQGTIRFPGGHLAADAGRPFRVVVGNEGIEPHSQMTPGLQPRDRPSDLFTARDVVEEVRFELTILLRETGLQPAATLQRQPLFQGGAREGSRTLTSEDARS